MKISSIAGLLALLGCLAACSSGSSGNASGSTGGSGTNGGSGGSGSGSGASGNRGLPDTTFAPDGVIENTLDYNKIVVVSPQSDGKILIGAMNNDQTTSAVIRLNADGSVDSTLSDPAIKNIPNGLYGGLYDVAADANGRIVVTLGETAIRRYTATGVLDDTFNTVESNLISNWTPFWSYAITVGQDGAIYAGGHGTVQGFTPPSGVNPYAFLQISDYGMPPDGHMLGCSNYSNYVTTAGWQNITHLSLLPTGALAFTINLEKSATSGGGTGVGRFSQPASCTLDGTYGTNGSGVWSSTAFDVVDALFETTGSVDLTTGESLVHIDPTGKSMTSTDLPLSGGGITRAPDGRYLVAGQYPPAGKNSMAVVYYSYSNGGFTPDMSVGKQGVITIPVSTALGYPAGVGLRAVYTPDGSSTVVVGSMQGLNADGTAVEHLVVARILN
ncbi:MAG: delta-60 repeat domain-containing protein [Polyangiaceae bacterium]|nr:delta-60 repeat domain-containing protein [Polyangiaceae bacterium]